MIEMRCRMCPFVRTYCDESVPQSCPECNSKSYRLTYLGQEMQPKTDFVGICFPNTERLSWSLGCNESQLPDMQRKHHGATFVKAEGGGYRMLITNRTEKKRRMKEAGLEEY